MLEAEPGRRWCWLGLVWRQWTWMQVNTSSTIAFLWGVGICSPRPGMSWCFEIQALQGFISQPTPSPLSGNDFWTSGQSPDGEKPFLARVGID